MSGMSIQFFGRLGSGIPGAQPKGGLLGGGAGSKGWSGMEGGNDRGQDRFYLRKARGQNMPTSIVTTPIITPFRLFTNSGDQAASINSAPIASLGAPNQVGGSTVVRLNAQYGGPRANGQAAYSGNPKYVYDGSDYTKFKKLVAINKTYNDSSFGGDQSNGSYVAQRAVRRF
jgi:hypothetical protein